MSPRHSEVVLDTGEVCPGSAGAPGCPGRGGSFSAGGQGRSLVSQCQENLRGSQRGPGHFTPRSLCVGNGDGEEGGLTRGGQHGDEAADRNPLS